MAYQRPMVTVDQNITIAPTSIEREQPAFIFGPNYELHRYSNAEEKPKTAIGTFKGAEILIRRREAREFQRPALHFEAELVPAVRLRVDVNL